MAAQKGQRRSNKLAAINLNRVGPGMHGDGGGLWLQVTPNRNGRSWIFRYTFNGRPREMGLGALNTIGLSEAREAAKQCRALLVGTPTTAPIDPIDHRASIRATTRTEAAKRMSFRQCAEAYIATHRAGWRNAKHAMQWSSTLATYVYPVFGALPVEMIDTTLVMKALEPIWTTTPETAGRVRGRIEMILDWAKAAEYRQGENPARWRGHLENLLVDKSTAARAARRARGKGEHHTALPYTEIGAFMAKLRQQSSVAARALEFLILTSARTDEVIGAPWHEIDLATGLWTIPAERMKAEREHRVPFSKAALSIIQGMAEAQAGDFVFPGGKAGRPLSNMALAMLLRRMGHGDVTVHGFRSTFRDWAGDCTDFPRDVAEMALAHKVGDAVELAYRRGDGLQKRRLLGEAWASYCNETKADDAAADRPKVVPLRRRRTAPAEAAAAGAVS